MDHLIPNGQHTPKQQVYYPDQQIRIECHPGYELDRLSPVQTCLKNGSWSPNETPKCLSKYLSIIDVKIFFFFFFFDQESPCGEPPSIPNAFLVNTTSTHAQYAMF